MANNKQDNQLSKPVERASEEEHQFALRAIKDVTGCGDSDARARLAAMDAKTVSKIAAHEREGKRPEIVKILYL